MRERGPVSFKSLPDNHLFAMSGNNGAARASQMKDRDSLIGILDALGIKDAYVSALGKLAPPIVGLIDLMMRRAEGIFEAHPNNDAEAAALTALATELVAIDGTPLTGKPVGGVAIELRTLLALARARLPACLLEMSNSDATSATLVNVASMLQDVEQQRRGYGFEDASSPAMSFLKKMAASLAAPGTQRCLPDINLMRVPTATEEKTGARTEARIGELTVSLGDRVEEGVESKASAPLVRLKMRLVFRALAVCSARAILEEDKNGPKAGGATSRHGKVAMGGATVRRDATVFEVERAFEQIHDRTDGLSGQEILRAFNGFWHLLQSTVSGAGDNHSVASALSIVCRELRVQSAAFAAMPAASTRGPPPTPPGGGNAARKKPKAAASPSKAGPSSSGKKRKEANSTGEDCKNFIAKGECKFGATCIHRHPRDRNDPASAGDARD